MTVLIITIKLPNLFRLELDLLDKEKKKGRTHGKDWGRG